MLCTAVWLAEGCWVGRTLEAVPRVTIDRPTDPAAVAAAARFSSSRAQQIHHRRQVKALLLLNHSRERPRQGSSSLERGVSRRGDLVRWSDGLNGLVLIVSWSTFRCEGRQFWRFWIMEFGFWVPS